MKRFQESNKLVQLWRLRHYVYIPFRFISYKLRSWGEYGELTNCKDKTYWSILVGSAQCDMNWTYTQEEVEEHLRDYIYKQTISKIHKDEMEK